VDHGREVPLPEAVTRTVRHEVGDLLQSLYATVTLLQQRLPAGADLEQRLLADLRSRAERCRELLDTVLDLVLPPSLAEESVDLAALTTTLVRDATGQYPHLELWADLAPVSPVQGDSVRLKQVGRFLLLHACRNARQRVVVRLGPAPTPEEVAWEFCDDGPPLSAAQLERLFVPFATAREGLVQVGVAFAGQIVTRHGGRVSAQNLGDTGVQLLALLPVRSPGGGAQTEGGLA
jgi:signal transduction histidine kinase